MLSDNPRCNIVGKDIDEDDDDGERHLETLGAAGEATENTLSGMGGQ